MKRNILIASILTIVLFVVSLVARNVYVAYVFDLVAFVTWLLGLITTIRIGRWGWAILIFFFTPITTLIYGITGPTTKKG